ncbi:MAG TPA: hypothetical protein VFZ98_13835 [Vicinamibacterales bacterium]
MSRHIRSIATAAAALTIAAPAASPQQPDTRFKAATTAVTVDVVVRDPRERPVTDLERGDFQLLEDGVLQQIGDVTLVADSQQPSLKSGETNVAGGNAASTASRPAAGTSAPTFRRTRIRPSLA